MDSGESPASKPIVVLVDDDRFLLDIYAMKFMRGGYDVRAYLSADDALTALRSGLTPSALLIDLVMPGLGGMSFLQTLHDEHIAADAPRIVLSNESEVDKTKAEALGVSRFIVKAMMLPDEVVAAVDEAIGKLPPTAVAQLHNSIPDS